VPPSFDVAAAESIGTVSPPIIVSVTSPSAVALPVVPPWQVVDDGVIIVEAGAASVVPPPPVAFPASVTADENDDVILVEDTLDASDCPFSAEFVADVVRAVPEWSVSYIFGELCRRTSMSLGARRLLLAMTQAAVASDRRTATDLAAAASIALAADPSGIWSVGLCHPSPAVTSCVAVLLPQFMSFCRHFALLSIVLSSRVSRVSFCRRSSVSGSRSRRKILL